MKTKNTIDWSMEDHPRIIWQVHTKLEPACLETIKSVFF